VDDKEASATTRKRRNTKMLLNIWRQTVNRLAGTGNDAGMTTAEYAVGTVAAAAFAAVLYMVVTGSSVVSGLGALVSKALSVQL
jgi:Protein of unknown function (DUF4244)